MAEVHGKGTKIFIAEIDVSGEGRSIDLTPSDRDTPDCSTFESTAKRVAPGAIKAAVDHRGVYTAVSSSGWESFLYGNLAGSTDKGIMVIPGTPAVAGIMYNGKIKNSHIGRPTSISDILAIEANYDISGMLGRGVVLEYEIAEAVVAQTGAGQNIGAITSADMWLVSIHCIYSTGVGTYTILVQECATDTPASYADVSGASVVVTAPARDSLVIGIQGARLAWARVKTTVSVSAAAKFAVGLSVVPYQ